MAQWSSFALASHLFFIQSSLKWGYSITLNESHNMLMSAESTNPTPSSEAREAQASRVGISRKSHESKQSAHVGNSRTHASAHKIKDSYLYCCSSGAGRSGIRCTLPFFFFVSFFGRRNYFRRPTRGGARPSVQLTLSRYAAALKAPKMYGEGN